MHQEREEPPFYGVNVLRNKQQKYIENLLKKYKSRKPTDELKKEIYDELQREKTAGNIIIPFKVALRKDITGQYPDTIEVILDTKV